jgi:zonula occludens toxin family protein
MYEKANPGAKKEEVVQVKESQAVQPSAPVEAELVDLVDVPALPSAAPLSALTESVASVPEFSEAYYRPRVEGMPETAPIYDGIRSVNRMESVAACIKGRKGCDCYTDFGTKVSIKLETCRDWAENGLPFNPYRREGVSMAEGQNARISQPDANTGGGGVYVMGGKDKLTLLPDYSKGPSAQ